MSLNAVLHVHTEHRIFIYNTLHRHSTSSPVEALYWRISSFFLLFTMWRVLIMLTSMSDSISRLPRLVALVGDDIWQKSATSTSTSTFSINLLWHLIVAQKICVGLLFLQIYILLQQYKNVKYLCQCFLYRGIVFKKAMYDMTNKPIIYLDGNMKYNEWYVNCKCWTNIIRYNSMI